MIYQKVTKIFSFKDILREVLPLYSTRKPKVLSFVIVDSEGNKKELSNETFILEYEIGSLEGKENE